MTPINNEGPPLPPHFRRRPVRERRLDSIDRLFQDASDRIAAAVGHCAAGRHRDSIQQATIAARKLLAAIDEQYHLVQVTEDPIQ